MERPNFRRPSLEEIASKQQPVKSAFDAPPSKSPLYDKKQERKKKLDDKKEEIKLTGKRIVNKTTGQVTEEKACTVSVAATNKASAKKEYEDYRPVVSLLEDCHATDNWTRRQPGEAMFGETLFRGYPFNSSGSDSPWIQQARVNIDHPDKSRDIVVNIRPRMILFSEKMSGGGVLHGPVKQEISFESADGPVGVAITRAGPGAQKGSIWQGFDRRKEDFKRAQESKGAGKWKHWAGATRRLCGCSTVESICISAPHDEANFPAESHLSRVLCVDEVYALESTYKQRIEFALDVFKEHCTAADFDLQDKHAGDNKNWIDAGSTPRRQPISATVRHKKDPQEEWSVHAIHRSGCRPFGVTYSVAIHLENQRVNHGAKRIYVRLTTRASSWCCVIDPLFRSAKFGAFVNDCCQAMVLAVSRAEISENAPNAVAMETVEPPNAVAVAMETAGA